MRLLAGAKLDIGRTRSSNQDALYCWANGPVGLFIVADGVGGSAAGDIASQLAIDTLTATLRPKLEEIHGGPQFMASHGVAGTAATGDPLFTYERQMLRLVNSVGTAIGKANRVLRRYGRKHPEAKGLGTTVALVAIVDRLAIVGHAGDSRGYLIRSRKIQRLTQDHSLVALLAAQGTISDQEIHSHPLRSGIYKSLGAATEVYPTITVHGLVAEDCLVVCSDGLWDMIDDTAIREIVRAALDDNPQLAADALVAAANEHGGADNISALVVHCLAM